MTFKEPLNTLRRNLLSTRRDDEFLFPVRNVEKSLLIHPSHISGMEPALRVPRVFCSLWSVKIALRHVRTSHQDFAVVRRYLNFHSLKGGSYTSDLSSLGEVYVRRDARLG